MMSQDGYYGSGCMDLCVAEQHNEVFFGPICRKGVWNFGFMPDWSFS